MTDVNSNNHHLLDLHNRRHLDSDGLATDLRVDLLHDVGGHRKIHFPGIHLENHLRENILRSEDALHHGVVSSSVQNVNGEIIHVILASSLLFALADEISDLDFDRIPLSSLVSGVSKLEAVNFPKIIHSKLPLTALEISEGRFSFSFGISIKNNKDCLLLERLTCEHRHLL